MVKRIVVAGAVAAVLVCVLGIGVWQTRVAEIAGLVRTRASVADTILTAGERNPETIVRAVAVPGVHVTITDRNTAHVYESAGSGVRVHPMGRRRFTLSHRPLGPPPPMGPGMPPLSPMGFIIGGLAHIPVEHFASGSLVIVVAADILALRTWLMVDVLIVGILLSVIVVGGILIGIRDARQHRLRLEATLEERRAAAAEFQRFLADAGHELRTPLTIISGFVDILSAKNNGDDAEASRIFDGMQVQAARMRGLVEKMLLLARLETPVSVPRLVNVGSVAQDVIDAMHARYTRREIHLQVDTLAEIIIDTDDLYEALQNLIENALKYAPESPVWITIQASAGHVIMTVEDHGPGIALQDQADVFKRFFRGEDRYSVEGTGLGLSIVGRVADRWNGSVQLESRPGMTIFTLRFPLADEERQ